MTLSELREQCGGWHGRSPQYYEKQVHQMPAIGVKDRTEFILSRCKGKTVLDIGASGPMHEMIANVATKCYGIDRPAPGMSAILGPQEVSPGVIGIDLDDYHAKIPVYPDVEIVICGEVLEHLSNPGWLLDRLRNYSCPMVVTVPNAFSDIVRNGLRENVELVNREHVAFYSWWTITNLLCRHGWKSSGIWYYNGNPKVAEGLIVLAE